ncbi:hypothetical protein ACLVWU_06780 [Bdellovibrio sp. HCB290]|uniref:hypothetical protein n=1 Tax=Bdellovibrio sp. HCB290 TaxID=3394356 RepID=UPI0039B6ADD3
MKTICHIIAVMLFAVPVFALQQGDALTSFKIENQFEEVAELNHETKLIVFTIDMKAAKLLSEYLNENAAKLDLAQTLIISDISKMPGLVSKMFAIPKMKKYAFKLALDKSGEVTKSWPRQEGKVTAIKMSQLKVESIEQIDSKEAIGSLFSQKVQP